MALATVLAVVAGFLPEALAGYFLGKGLDVALNSGAKLEDELQDVIQNTITEFSDRDARTYGRNLPFYHSVKIVSELLKFRVMAPEDFKYDDLMLALSNEPEIIPPSELELNAFFALFMSKINASDGLKKLEIKDTYSQEIFNISRQIGELGNRIDKLAQSYTGDLEIQWKDRVDTYVKTSQDFKPATALKLLESLEKSLSLSANKPSKSFMAFLEFQKGQCLGFIGQKEEAYRSKLKAWDMDKSNVLYGQSAAISLFRMKDENELNKVLGDLIQLDNYNPVVWALRVASKAEADLDLALEDVPLFVRTDLTFRRVLYNETNPEVHYLMHDRKMVPQCLDYQQKAVTVDNYNEAIFWINSTLEAIFHVYYLDYYENNQQHRKEMEVLHSMLDEFLKVVRGSEISDNFEKLEFLHAYTTFSLSSNQNDALLLEAIYLRMQNKETLYAIQAANALQLTGLKSRAVSILEKVTNLTSEGLLLLMLCYQKMDEMTGYLEASKRFVHSISHFEERFLPMFLNLLVELKLRGQLYFFNAEDFLSGKSFDDSETEKLVGATVALIFNNIEPGELEFLIAFAQNCEDDKLANILGSAFFAAGYYEVALELLGKNLDGKSASRELYQYINAYSKTGKDWGVLLRLLEDWRKNLPFNDHFLRMEAQLRQQLVDWPAVVEICEIYLKELPDDSAMLALYVQALHRLNTPESIEKIKGVPELAKKADFHRPVHVIPIAQILLLHGMHEEAFELIYPFAKDPSQIQVRAAYTGLVLGRKDHGDALMEYDVVEYGYFVSYAKEGRVSYVEMDEAAKSHAVHKHFIGKSKGDKVCVERRMSSLQDEYTIKRITNKYLALFDEILNQAKDDPHVGLPFEMLEIDPEHPGGILGMFEKMFGKKHQIEEKTKDADFNNYYQGALSFSELMSAQYNQLYTDGYYGLIRYRNGIRTFRNLVFDQHQLNDQSQVVLDFTSLALMYQIWMFHEHEFQHKFIVSRYLVELFSNELSSLQYHADPFRSSTVDLGKVAIDTDHFDFLKDKKKYLGGLLEWIDRYCEVTLSENTIDMIKKAGIHMGENHVIDAAMSTLLLVTDDPNRILVSDDSFSLKMQLLPLDRMMSAEHYLKQTTEPSSPVFDELVHNRYIRYSPTAKQLNEAYIVNLSGQYSNYDLLLENLSLINDRANVETALTHLKDIALKPLLSREQLIKDLTIAMVNLFKDCTETLIDLFATKLYFKFDLLGTRQDDVMMAYNDAKIIVLERRCPNNKLID